MMDESTDRGDVKRVGVFMMNLLFVVRLFFLGLYDIPQINAANLFECLDL